ncbi:hypothetical protein [Vibrio sp. VB16]|uniref:hypothetical protein n=1 Tax=Vibrio sp. VB16 TaxID=2785746 RepID=UPI00189D361C|nr:hypothetical protein [Vibrio sp. VB16]UGA54993.1 glucosyltransferase domain-containing protein [Vibrio sp. VB16]
MKNRLFKFLVDYSFPLVVSFFYFLINYSHLFSLTASSDPLQYVEPALHPIDGFPYTDRVLLWLWIRVISVLPISVGQIGGIATLLLSTLTLALVTAYLYKKWGVISGILFTILYISSPTILGVASYTYPMHMLTIAIVLSIIILDGVNGSAKKIFISGCFLGIMLLSKIQGYAFVFYIFYLIVTNSKNIKDFIRFGFISSFGCALTLSLVFGFIFIYDGYDTLIGLFASYLSGGAETQFSGRALGGLPPFYFFLAEPTAVIAIIGLLLPIFFKKFRLIKEISIIGVCQLIGLLLIYIITQRGGPVIANYFLDSYVVGLLCFSICFGHSIEKRTITDVYAYLLLVTSFVYLEYLAVTMKYKNTVYTPLHLKYESTFNIVLWSIMILSITMLILSKKVLSKSKLVVILSSVVFVSLVRINEGVSDAKFRREYNRGYHVTSQYIQSFLDQGKSVWTYVKLNRSDIDTGTARLKMIFDALYYDGVGDAYFGRDPRKEYDVLITTSSEIYSNQGNDFKRIEPKSSSNVDENLQLDIKGINAIPQYGVSVGGLVGNATITKVSQSNETIFELIPDVEKDFLIQLDYSSSEHLNAVKGQTVFLVPQQGIDVLDFTVRLYVQFKNEGKWSRESFTLKNTEDKPSVSIDVPETAEKVQYGWIVSNGKSNTPTSLRLPNIDLNLIDSNDGSSKMVDGFKYWVVE